MKMTSSTRRKLTAIAQLIGAWLAGAFVLILAGSPILLVILILLNSDN